jgi:hypothetical protein
MNYFLQSVRIAVIGFIFLVISSVSCISSAHANVWRTEIPQAKLIGSGEFSWWGLSIYSAKLWQAPGSPSTGFDAMQRFALEITYHKSISRSRFVDTSVDEIKRLHGSAYSAEQLQAWRTYMEKAFMDVKSGDQLIGVHIPDFGCRFYSQNKLLAEIPDEKFSKAFFSIWLDPKSKDTALRAQLMGQSK